MPGTLLSKLTTQGDVAKQTDHLDTFAKQICLQGR